MDIIIHSLQLSILWYHTYRSSSVMLAPCTCIGAARAGLGGNCALTRSRARSNDTAAPSGCIRRQLSCASAASGSSMGGESLLTVVRTSLRGVLQEVARWCTAVRIVQTEHNRAISQWSNKYCNTIPIPLLSHIITSWSAYV